MGSRVHEVLEKLYLDLQHSKVNSLDDLLHYFHQNWEKNWHDRIVIVKKEYAAEHYRATGERCVRDYYNRHTPFDDGTTLGLEVAVNVKLENGKYLLKGFIDRLVKNRNGCYEIHDYKTSRSVPQQHYLDQYRQLALYQIAVEEMWPDVKEVDLVWHYLANDVDLRSKRTAEQLESLKKDIVRRIQEIEAAEDFPPNESALCGWCVYQYLCPRKKHLYRTERMDEEEFVHDDGVALVDKFAALKEQESLLKEQLQELKDAIKAYAERENVTAVRGTNSKVKIQYQYRTKFADSPELRQLLEENRLWPEISRVDDKLLLNLINSEKINPALKAQIRTYQEEKEIRVTRLCKL